VIEAGEGDVETVILRRKLPYAEGDDLLTLLVGQGWRRDNLIMQGCAADDSDLGSAGRAVVAHKTFSRVSCSLLTRATCP